MDALGKIDTLMMEIEAHTTTSRKAGRLTAAEEGAFELLSSERTRLMAQHKQIQGKFARIRKWLILQDLLSRARVHHQRWIAGPAKLRGLHAA